MTLDSTPYSRSYEYLCPCQLAWVDFFGFFAAAFFCGTVSRVGTAHQYGFIWNAGRENGKLFADLLTVDVAQENYADL